jgi:hypothetical protein
MTDSDSSTVYYSDSSEGRRRQAEKQKLKAKDED